MATRATGVAIITSPLCVFLATALAGAPQAPPAPPTSDGTTPSPTLSPDPELLRTNRLLRQHVRRGDRWLVGAPWASTPSKKISTRCQSPQRRYRCDRRGIGWYDHQCGPN